MPDSSLSPLTLPQQPQPTATLPPISIPASTPRIVGIDLARAIAILGMVLVNYWIVLSGFDSDGSAGAWWAQQCAGRASALFVVLAGVGVTLLTSRARAAGEAGRARALLLYRAAFLFVLGLLFVPIWPADILHYYGAYLTLAAVVVMAPQAVLWSLCPIAILSFVGLLFVFDYGADWNWYTLEYRGFWQPDGFLRNLLFNGFHPVVPWIAFLFAGMAIGRTKLGTRRTNLTLVIVGCALFGLAMGIAEVARSMAGGPTGIGHDLLSTLAGASSMPPTPLYVLQALGLAVAILGACLELGKLVTPRLLFPLCATGQLALTLYVLHVLGLGVIEATHGKLGTFSARSAAEASLWFFAASIAFATLWRWKLSQGPLEWVMRKVRPRPTRSTPPS